jgi:RND family efflux transporter MFP subunit
MNMTAPRRVAAFAAILVSLPLLACGHHGGDETDTAGIVPVSVEAARRGTIRAIVAASGAVKPATGAELVVVPPLPARIAELPVGVGDRVRKGGLLVRFEIPSLASDLTARESDVRRAQAALETAKAANDRAKGLFDRGIAAGKDVESARRDLADAESGVAESESALASAKLLVGRTVVRAPFDGVVTARAHNPGDFVDVSTPDAIVRFVDPARLQIEASVPVDDLARLKAGAVARVIGPSSFAPEAATVLSVPGAVDPLTAIATVRLDFTTTTALPSGTPVRVEITADERAGALIVPAAALVREAEDVYVYTVASDNVARRKKVAVGIVAEPDAEILSGLDEGERVIARGATALPDGAHIAIRE